MKNIITTILFLACQIPSFCCVRLYRNSLIKAEILTIQQAAERNQCKGDDFLILLAIRKAENGRPGLEFGVKHPVCLARIKKEPHKSLDIQAGWAAATIVKNRMRWREAKQNNDFITFLGNRYCPASVDPEGNKTWKRNVRYWFKKLNNK